MLSNIQLFIAPTSMFLKSTMLTNKECAFCILLHITSRRDWVMIQLSDVEGLIISFNQSNYKCLHLIILTFFNPFHDHLHKAITLNTFFTTNGMLFKCRLLTQTFKKNFVRSRLVHPVTNWYKNLLVTREACFVCWRLKEACYNSFENIVCFLKIMFVFVRLYDYYIVSQKNWVVY